MATRRSTRNSSVISTPSLTFLPTPELEPKSQKRKKIKLESSNSVNASTADPTEFRNELLSEYEMARLENIKRNEQFLSNLGLNEAKVSLETTAVEKKPTKRGVSKNIRLHTSVDAPSRRSGRVTVDRLKAELQELQKDDTNNADLIKQKEEELSELLTKRYESSYTSVIDSNYSQEDVVRVDKSPVFLSDCLNKDGAASDGSHRNELFDHITNVASGECVVTSEFKEYQVKLTNMTVTEDDVAKMCRSRITAVLVHPNQDKLVVLAGDKDGYVGLWDVNNLSDDTGGVLTYRTHNANVTRFYCCESNASKIYSASYDGTIRCLDTKANAFVVSFDAPDNTDNCFTSDCFFASHQHGSDVTAFIGKSDGNMAFADFRASSTAYQWQFPAQLSKVNSIQEHPTNANLVITAGSSKAGCIRVHDIRKAGKTSSPLVEIDEHSKSINAAFVSGDGEFMVSVSLDNTVRTWSNFILPGSKPACEVIRRDNHTGRWLSTFRPTFDPKQSRCYALGSMQRQRVVEVFSISHSVASGSSPATQLMRQLHSDYLQSIISSMIVPLLVAVLIANVSAFSPAMSGRVISNKFDLKMGFEKEIGAQPPLGFFDPLGLLKTADQERFDQLRAYEVKHGRVAMLAVLGHILTTAGWRANGEIAFGVPFSSIKSGLAAFDTIPLAGTFQLIGFIGLLELGFGYQEKNIADECKLRMNEWGWSADKQKSKYAIELNNGRAAQMGILTLVVHEKLNNDPYIINSLLGSPVPFN